MTAGLTLILFIPLLLDYLATFQFVVTNLAEFRELLDIRHTILWNTLTMVGPPLGIYSGFNVINKFSPVEKYKVAERREERQEEKQEEKNNLDDLLLASSPESGIWSKADVKIELVRLKSTANWSVGFLRVLDTSMVYGSIEDEPREIKTAKETRIPAGDYPITFNKADTLLTRKYKERFSEWFTWHIEIQDIPDFDKVYIHIGNDEKDTAGCPLIGFYINYKEGTNGNSTDAYKEFYIYIKEALVLGKTVAIRIKDED